MLYFLAPIFMIIQAGIPCKWTNDGQCFLLEHFDTIQDSPSQIYHSALPLLPPPSWLYSCYHAEFLQEIKVVKGLSAGWGTCFRAVFLSGRILALSCWNKIIAVGFRPRDIIILDAITGSQVAILSGHTDEVNSVTFSSDGKLLVSGSDDKTVKLWDVQTGGVIRTYLGHTGLVRSAAISVDHTTIASGSWDRTVRLWDVQTGRCHHVINQHGIVFLVCFSPMDPKHFLSISNHEVQQWNTEGDEGGSAIDAYYADFSSDGTQFVFCSDGTATIQNLNSGMIVAKFQIVNDECQFCCFSPDGGLIAVTAGSTGYIWDITGSSPYIIETIGHTGTITSLRFSSPSSLISVSNDQSVKFWQIGTPSINQAEADPKPIPLTSSGIRSITLQVDDGVTITSDSDGVVKIWDISTGCCKATFQTQAKDVDKRDVQLINGKLVFVWHTDGKIKIWDVEKEELLLAVDGPSDFQDLKISGDGSRIFSLGETSIQVQSLQTGEIVSKAEIEYIPHGIGSLTVDDSRVWIHFPNSEDQVWDFGTSGSSPVKLPNTPLVRFHPNGAVMWDISISSIREKATGKVIFQLSRRYGKSSDVQWDGQCLVACFISGEVLVIDLGHLLPQ